MPEHVSYHFGHGNRSPPFRTDFMSGHFSEFLQTFETTLSSGSYLAASNNRDLIATSVIIPAVIPNNTPNITIELASSSDLNAKIKI